jgi:hypothetical protein
MSYKGTAGSDLSGGENVSDLLLVPGLNVDFRRICTASFDLMRKLISILSDQRSPRYISKLEDQGSDSVLPG